MKLCCVYIGKFNGKGVAGGLPGTLLIHVYLEESAPNGIGMEKVK